MANVKAYEVVRKLLDYLEVFSLTCQLTNSISNENLTVSYSVNFDKFKLSIDIAYLSSGSIKGKVQYGPTYGRMVANLKDGNEVRTKYDKITKVVKVETKSFDRLKSAMSFTVNSLEDLNVLINLLIEED